MSHHYVTLIMSLLSCLDLMSLIACHSSHVSLLRHSSHVTLPMSLISFVNLMSLISCHLSHVSISCHSFHVSISCHSSHVTHLNYHHYVTHLKSHHYVTNLMSQHHVNDTKLLPIYSQVATLNFCPWLLPISYRIILPVTSAHFLRSNLSPTRSVLLPGRIGIGFQGVSHSSQSRSHVTQFISRSHVNLITCHSSHLSSLRHSSHVSSLSHSSHVSSLRLYTLGWPYLTSIHFLCPLVTAGYYRWPLPTPSAVTYAHPAASFCSEG